VSVASLPGALVELGAYVAATRDFLGTTTASFDIGEFEECLRMRAAEAGASSALAAADEAVLPSLHDFLARR
jgi:hypothetical protein